MKVLEKWKTILRWKLSEKTKKILTTVLIALAVCAFFVWLGNGMVSAATKTGREGMVPFYLMMVAFPFLILVLSGIRVYRICSEADTEASEQNDTITEE